MAYFSLDSDILHYIVSHQMRPGERLPTIPELSQEMGVSVGKIREELAVARTLGLIQIKPRTGTQVQEFDFGPAATLSVLYALGLNREYFHDFSRLRKSVELSFWHEAVVQLTPDDLAYLRELVVCAQHKLSRVPIEVPFEEHRRLHLTLYKHLDNVFVQGILEAYWEAYKAFGLALYADLAHHRQVWSYHEQMVDCLAQHNIEGGYQALKEHMALLRYVPEQSDAGPQASPERPAPIRHFFE